MAEGVRIKGGAGEFEAAVIAVVLDRIAAEQAALDQGGPTDRRLPAWVRAIDEGGTEGSGFLRPSLPQLP